MNTNHKKIKLILKITGITLMIIGLIFTIIGLVDFFGSFNSMESPSNFWTLFVGIPSLGIGLTLTILGFQREIFKYQKDETIGVHKEMYHDLHPEIKDMVNTIKGKDDSTEDVIKCSKCGTYNDKGDMYCKKCGHQLSLNNKKSCPHCGASIDVDATFCPKCGKNL